VLITLTAFISKKGSNFADFMAQQSMQLSQMSLSMQVRESDINDIQDRPENGLTNGQIQAFRQRFTFS
jgi:hypothetical protein